MYEKCLRIIDILCFKIFLSDEGELLRREPVAKGNRFGERGKELRLSTSNHFINIHFGFHNYAMQQMRYVLFASS